MTLVVDSSVVVAALVDTGPLGAWAEAQVFAHAPVAPHLMPVEVANTLRRLELAGEVAAAACALAHADLLQLRVTYFPYEAVAERVWELRHTITAYDATFVALAELLDAPLATLDAKLAAAPGTRCTFSTPDV